MSAPSSSIILDKSNPVSPLSIPASQTAVLLLDYHQLLFPRIAASSHERVVSGANALRAWARASGAPLVIHGLIDLSGPMLPTLKSAERMEGLQSALAQQPGLEAEHTAIAPDANANTDANVGSAREVTLKRTLGVFSAMHSRGLRELLAQHGIKSLVIGGISTSGCAMRTATQAADEGFVVTLIEDACADPSPEVHDAVLTQIVVPNVHVCSSEEWAKAWKEM